MFEINSNFTEKDIAHYTCYRSSETIKIDGDLTKSVWQRVNKSPRFVDMVSGMPGYFDTKAACLWDDRFFLCGILG